MAANNWLHGEGGYEREKVKRPKSRVAGYPVVEKQRGSCRSVELVPEDDSSGVAFLLRNCTFFKDISRELFDMDSEIKRLEKQVGEANGEISGLNEGFGGVEQILSSVKEPMIEIKEALSQRKEGAKSPLVQSLNKAGLVQMVDGIGSGGGAEKMVRHWPGVHRPNQRLEMPVFSGEDPCGWILKAERYFMLHGIEERVKVAYATLHMEGKALNWLLWIEARNPIHGWEMFKHELMERFQTTERVAAYEQLLSLKQSTTVACYREQFELLSAPFIRDMSEEMIICTFINGLNDDIKAGLKSIEPRDLAHVMSLAQEIEDKLKISEMLEGFKLTGSFGNYYSIFNSHDEMFPSIVDVDPNEFRSYSSKNSTLTNPHHPGETETGRSTMEVSRGSSMAKTVSKPKEMGGTSRKQGGFKKMTEAEFKFRMEMSLCFLCDEHSTEDNDHDCKNKHLQLIVVDNADDELFDEGEKDEEEEQATMMEESQNGLSMNSTVAINSSTFKFLGKIGPREVIVKIGSGASHNYISKEVVAELQIPVERTRSFRVNCGIGPKAEGAGVCKNVLLKAQGIDIVASFFPTKLGFADVVLGSEWLRSVGRFFFQGSPLTMTFELHGRTVTLQSDPALTKGMELGLMILEWDEEN